MGRERLCMSKYVSVHVSRGKEGHTEQDTMRAESVPLNKQTHTHTQTTDCTHTHTHNAPTLAGHLMPLPDGETVPCVMEMDGHGSTASRFGESEWANGRVEQEGKRCERRDQGRGRKGGI